MSLAAVVRIRAKTSTTLAQPNLLGADPFRFFHLAAPQNMRRPYVTYEIPDGAPEHHLLGAGGLWQGRISVDVYSDNLTDMETIVEEIRLKCDTYRGDVIVDATTYSVRRMHWESQSEDVQYLDPAKPLPTFHTIISLACSITQTIPTFT